MHIDAEFDWSFNAVVVYMGDYECSRGSRRVVKPVEFELMEIGEAEPAEPAITLTKEQAVKLMDALSEALKPFNLTPAQRTDELVAAKDENLDDLRRILRIKGDS